MGSCDVGSEEALVKGKGGEGIDRQRDRGLLGQVMLGVNLHMPGCVLTLTGFPLPLPASASSNGNKDAEWQFC